MNNPHQNSESLSHKNTLSIIIPVYNEKTYLRNCVERVLAVELPMDLRKEIIIVDDASNDGTNEVIKELAIQYPDTIKALFHKANQGKGTAIRTAIKELTGQFTIIQDADLEYDPNEYPILLQPILQGHADVVYGSRLSGGAPQRVHMFWHLMGNKFLSFTTNLLYNTTLTDMETGYKVFKTEIIKGLNLKSRRFEIEPEITAKIFKRKYRVYEIPISYFGRTYEEGKKISWKDGFIALWTIFKYRFME